jgi:hypothetical protein
MLNNVYVYLIAKNIEFQKKNNKFFVTSFKKNLKFAWIIISNKAMIIFFLLVLIWVMVK